MLEGSTEGIMHDSAACLPLLPKLGKTDLHNHNHWREVFQKQPPQILGRDLLIQILGYRLREHECQSFTEAINRLSASARDVKANRNAEFLASPSIKPGTSLVATLVKQETDSPIVIIR